MDTNWISLCVQMIGVVIAILSYKLQLHNNTHEKQVPPINGDAQSGPINTVLSNNGKNVNIAKVFMVIGILFFASGFSYNIYELIKNDDGLEQRPGDRQFPIVNQTEPLLVFAGGGSVVNMIKEITKGSVDIKNYRNSNSIYLDLPSTNAWSLLAEEVMINHTSDSITKKFYPVCLSAIEANDGVFHKMVSFDDFTEKGTVISYYIGEDVLQVYTNNKEITGNKVSISDLSKLVKKWCTDKTVDVYITQEGSGTYLTYQSLLKDTVLLKENAFDIDNYKEVLKWYGSNTKHRTLTGNNREFLLLTCGYYTPEDIKGKYEPKVVINPKRNESEKDVFLTKSMYLYFAGYRNEEDYIIIPKEMVNLLNDLKKKKKDRIRISNNKMYQFKADIITPIDTLIIWDEKFNNNSK